MTHLLLTVSACVLCLSSVSAADLGVYGHVYPILEQDLSEVIQSKLSSMTPQEHTQFQASLRDHYVKSAEEPTPVAGVGESTQYRSFEFDPTLILKEDIRDHTGEVLFPKGTQVNPLDHVSLDEDLLFFDGSNPKHLLWAQKQLQERPNKWILVKGRPTELESQEGRAVYFDQGGLLCRRFKITNAPARVSQLGKSLFIEEVPAERSRVQDARHSEVQTLQKGMP